jgi:lipid-A-disaccharide synthase
VAYRIFISTGEVSGDLQGALLVRALYRQAQARGIDLDILALGGDRMVDAGAKLLGKTTAIGSIGLVESLPYLWPTLRLQSRVKRYLRQHPPDLVIMIDYLGPNLGIGHFVRRQLPQVPTVYYIAPQEWVWSLSPRNTRQIVEMSDRLIAIFPEEARYYRHWGADTVYMGHPLVDRVQTFPNRNQAREALGIAPDEVAIALLPASRRQELRYLLPAMFQAAQQIQAQIPTAKFWIPLSLDSFRRPLKAAIQKYGLRARLVADQTPEVLAAADLAIAKSGTVNLELALLHVPQVVTYRLNPITAWIAEHILKFSAPFVSPPNLMLMEAIVPELLQRQATPDKIAREALEILLNPLRRQQIEENYQRMEGVVGEVGVCDRAAQEILRTLESNEL